MVNFDEVFDRIRLATSTRTQVELAEVLNIRQSSISDAKRRNSVPSDWFLKLFEQFGLNPDWLKKGSGPMYLRTEQGYTPMDAPPALMASEETIRSSGMDAKNSVVTVYSTTQSSVEGEEPGQQILGRLSIPQSFAGNGIHVFRIDVSSMEPFIHKGAYVGIDTAQRHVASGELYAIRLPYEGVVLRRAYINTQQGTLTLRSENTTLPEISLPLDGHEERVVGRVTWVLQRL